MSEKFGNIAADADLEKILTCREIVKRIVEFGVTQEQIVTIIQLLGYELENHDHMLEVVGLTKEILGTNGPLLVTKAGE
jgi:hypothetical protein